MKLLFTCFLCLMCGCLCAKEAESSINSNIIANYVVKWGDTRTAHADCSNTSEGHVILGHCPSVHSIDLYYIASTLAHLGARKILPEDVGKYLGGNNINVNAYIDTEHHSSISVRMSF